jgi:hypothetical protein
MGAIPQQNGLCDRNWLQNARILEKISKNFSTLVAWWFKLQLIEVPLRSSSTFCLSGKDVIGNISVSGGSGAKPHLFKNWTARRVEFAI